MRLIADRLGQGFGEGQVGEARRLLREVLLDRIVFRPVPRPAHLPPPKGPGRKARLVYQFEGEATLPKVLANLIHVSSVVAPTGSARRSVGLSSVEFSVLALP